MRRIISLIDAFLRRIIALGDIKSLIAKGIQKADLYGRRLRIIPRKDGITQFDFKIDNHSQIDSLEVYLNNKYIKSIQANKAAISIALPVISLSWISIQAVKMKDGFKHSWYLIDYDVL